MKSKLYFFTLAILLCATVFPAHAETTIAFVDVSEVIAKSKAGKAIQKQVKKKKDTFLSDLTKQENKIREEEKKLIALKDKATKEEFLEKRKAFEDQFLNARKDAQKKKEKIDIAFSKAMSKLKKEIENVVRALAEKKSIQLVISNQIVLVGSKSLDLTQEAIADLDKAVSEIKLENAAE